MEHFLEGSSHGIPVTQTSQANSMGKPPLMTYIGEGAVAVEEEEIS